MIHRYENIGYHEQRELADRMDADRTKQEKMRRMYPREEGIWKGNLYFKNQEALDKWNEETSKW